MEQKTFSTRIREIIANVSLRNTTPENYGVLTHETKSFARVISTRTDTMDLRQIASALRQEEFCVLSSGTNYLTIGVKNHTKNHEISTNSKLSFEEALSYVKKFTGGTLKVIPHNYRAGATIITSKVSKYNTYLFEVLIHTLRNGGMTVNYLDGCNFIEFFDAAAEQDEATKLVALHKPDIMETKLAHPA